MKKTRICTSLNIYRHWCARLLYNYILTKLIIFFFKPNLILKNEHFFSFRYKFNEEADQTTEGQIRDMQDL